MSMLHGLILAGGHSRRMGRDKSAIAYHGSAQTYHLAQLVAPYTSQCFVSIREQQKDATHLAGLSPVFDHYAIASPLNGIVSAMRDMLGASFLVIAVDMPHIDASAIETLLSHRDASKAATCFESPIKGGPDPLFAIWEAHAFRELDTRLRATDSHTCPRTILQELGAHVISAGVPDSILENINTPEEYATLQVAL